jgi:AcrR family transcriptional regulator
VRRRPGGRSARVRRAVLAATIEELAEVGYGAFGFDGVARRAGVHRTTLYRRWRSREDLLVDAIAEYAQVAVPIPDTGSVRDDLLRYATSIVRSVAQPTIRAVVAAYVAEADHNPELAEAVRRYWADRRRLARAMVDRAIERGELPASADADRVFDHVLGPIYLRLLVTREPLAEAELARIVDSALAAARTPSAPGTA